MQLRQVSKEQGCTRLSVQRVAAAVNDMDEANINAALVERSGAELSRTEERLIEMPNGCIDRSLRDELLAEVSWLAQEGRIDHLLIESAWISEPITVAQTFAADSTAWAELCLPIPEPSMAEKSA